VGVTHHSRQFGFQNAVQQLDNAVSVQFGYDRYSVPSSREGLVSAVGSLERSRISLWTSGSGKDHRAGGRSADHDGTAGHADPHLILPS
jgi:hypothetical protein